MSLLFVTIVALANSQQAGLNASAGRELVVNGGFEKVEEGQPMPEGWTGDRGVFSIDSAVCRSGQGALKYSNADPDRYRLATQKVPLEPGHKYRFGGWVKADAITGRESGATLCLEWQGKDGKWMGGCYPSGVKGTRDWTRVEEIVRVPAEAGAFHLACYCRKGMAGTAWFDDVTIERVVDPPMRSVLISPGYRGRITAEGPGV